MKFDEILTKPMLSYTELFERYYISFSARPDGTIGLYAFDRKKKHNVLEYDIFRKMGKLSHSATVAKWINGKTMEAQKRSYFIMTDIDLGLNILREYGAIIKREEEKT